MLEDDDSAMSVKTALAVINRVWEEIENELDQAFDAETQVALARLYLTEHVEIEKIRDKTNLDIDIASQLAFLMPSTL